MFKKIIPNYRFKKITDIPYDFFSGSQLLIFDLDNTLVFPETTKTTKETTEWFLKIKEKFPCVIVSNSWSFKKRAEKVSQIFGCDIFLSKRKKPFRKLFQELKNKYKFKNEKVLVVGDRLFTDVLFGNLNCAKSVLVEPLNNTENLLIKFVRIIEKCIIKTYGKQI